MVALFEGDFGDSACKYTIVSLILMNTCEHDLLLLNRNMELKQNLWILCVIWVV